MKKYTITVTDMVYGIIRCPSELDSIVEEDIIMGRLDKYYNSNIATFRRQYGYPGQKFEIMDNDFNLEIIESPEYIYEFVKNSLAEYFNEHILTPGRPIEIQNQLRDRYINENCVSLNGIKNMDPYQYFNVYPYDEDTNRSIHVIRFDKEKLFSV